MALDNWTNLKAAVASWLNRTDLTTPIQDDFIPAFEGKARRQLQDWLRTVLTQTNVTGDLAVPNCDQVLAVALNDGAGGSYNAPLPFLTREGYQRRMAEASTVVAPTQEVFVDRDESAATTTLRFYPPVSAASPIANLRILYVATLPALGAGQATNALLTNAPDVYLKGTLAEAAQFLQWADAAVGWAGERDAGFAKLIAEAKRRASPGIPGRRRLPRVFG